MEVKTKAPTEQSLLFGDLDKPSLHALSYALRHPDTWPKGFVWDYKYCDDCAMGLAHALWANKVEQASIQDGPTIMARAFAMPYADARSIFLGNHGKAAWLPTKEKATTVTHGHLWWAREEVKRTTKTDYSAVTPEMVADQIDAYLATAE